ncbi:MAG: glycosyltransferase family 2 protein [Rhodospirillales bacterium]|nr:glycosyltransferase family 2 protein [Rhodospirillales bacterium]
MSGLPRVDVTLFVHDGAATVGAAIESVLAQTWPALSLSLIDDGSTDGTGAILAEYAARDPAIRLHRIRRNSGAVAAFQRGFWFGDADFLLPKSADDVIAPDFVERCMAVLLAHPDCAMCHGGALIFAGAGEVRGVYPDSHRLDATGPDPLSRARHVMARYTSSPSFWGVYRRAATDTLSPIRYRAGWDHVVLAELALAGEIRHVPELLYWRRDGGRPVLALARAATAQARVGLPLEDSLAEQRWRTPLITTAYAHQEMFAAARLPHADRAAMMADAARIFRERWLGEMRREAAALGALLPGRIAALAQLPPPEAGWHAEALRAALAAAAAIVPEVDLTMFAIELAAWAQEAPRAAA